MTRHGDGMIVCPDCKGECEIGDSDDDEPPR